MCQNLDDLAEFAEFRAVVLPQIRQALHKGMSAKEILEKFKPYAVARLVNTALIGEAGTALTAAKEMLDRTDGKVTTTLDLQHKYAGLSDEALDALLQSKLQKQNLSPATKLPPSSGAGSPEADPHTPDEAE